MGWTRSRSASNLDDSEGPEDGASLFALELPPEDASPDEEGVDPIPVEGLDEDAEYGWTDDSRSDDEPWDAELDLPGLTPLARDDGGEEGVDETADLGLVGDEVPHLPPLRGLDDSEEEVDNLALGDDAWIMELSEPESVDAVLPPRHPACEVAHLGPKGAVNAFEPGPPPLAAGPGGLFRVDTPLEPLAAAGLDDAEVVSLVAEGRRVLVGTRLHGGLRSEDGGASFTPANGWAGEGREIAQELALVREPGGRVWALTPGGALFRSDDFGASWVGPLLLKTVVALAAVPEGGVLALSGGRDAPQLARSEDGGQRWTAVDVPALGPGVRYLDALRESVVLSADGDSAGPFLSNDRGKRWMRVPGLPPAGPVALAREPGGLTLYAAHFAAAEDRGVVVRYPTTGGEAALVLDVAEEAAARGLTVDGDPDGAHRVLAIDARAGDDGTVLHVATSCGLFRVRLDPERAP